MRWRPPCGAPAGAFLGLAVLCLFVVLALGCGQPAAAPRTTDEPTTTTTVPVTVELQAILPASVPVETALRVNPPITVAQLGPAAVDALLDAEWADYPCNQWAGEAVGVGWPLEQMPKVLRTMWRESRCDPTVRSTTSDSSLMQINDIVLRDWRFQRDWPDFDRTTIFDPYVNLSVALWLFGIDGWRPWLGGA